MSLQAGLGLEVEGSRLLETAHGRLRIVRLRDAESGERAWLLTRGDVTSREPLLARVHSSCVTSETFGGCDCDCAGQLDAGLRRIAETGRGALFYLFQEGRGAGFLAKARDRMLVQASGHRLTTFDAYAQMGLGADARRYELVAAICRWAGIAAPLRLLSNNPEKRAALERDGVRIAGSEPLQHAWSPFNLHYVVAKRRSGHRLAHAGKPPLRADLPERVREVTPHALPEAPQLLCVARYLLPVPLRGRPAETPLWLWLHAYLDRESGRERVAFTHGRGVGAAVPSHVQHEVLLERLPLPLPPAARDASARGAWQRALAGFASAGAGVAVFLPPDASLPRGEPDPATRALLAHHREALARSERDAS